MLPGAQPERARGPARPSSHGTIAPVGEVDGTKEIGCEWPLLGAEFGSLFEHATVGLLSTNAIQRGRRSRAAVAASLKPEAAGPKITLWFAHRQVPPTEFGSAYTAGVRARPVGEELRVLLWRSAPREAPELAYQNDAA
jgi:hypothetical protein